MVRYFDGLGNDVTAYVLSLEAKVKALTEEMKKQPVAQASPAVRKRSS